METATYIVSLPVIVNVASDGTVTLDVDTTELTAALRDETTATDRHLAVVEQHLTRA